MEVCRLKLGWDEVTEQGERVKRENKNLAEEIRDLMDQLGEGQRAVLDLEKQRRRLEVEIIFTQTEPSSPNLQLEKENLQTGLEEAEATLEQEENKVLRAQLELSLLRKEIDKRIEEKQEEFNNTR